MLLHHRNLRPKCGKTPQSAVHAECRRGIVSASSSLILAASPSAAFSYQAFIDPDWQSSDRLTHDKTGNRGIGRDINAKLEFAAAHNKTEVQRTEDFRLTSETESEALR
jgi:hypothetical protein